jgi:c-di-GMP phosphodiesterase
MDTAAHPAQRSGAADAFVARQAIFDRDLSVVGYELLFRGAAAHTTAQFTDRDQASTRVILDTFLELGLDQIVGQTPAFLNLTRSFFLSTHNIPLPRERVVLELLEGEHVDAPLVESVRGYAQSGFRIALDDFVYDDKMIPLLEIADIVKFDVLEHAPSQLEQQVRKVLPYNVVLLAEKVETPEHFEFCKDLGFDLYQGYFLCRPNTVAGHRIAPNRLATLRLLAKLQDPNVEMTSLEQIIREDLSLSYKLLRLINSAFYGLPHRVESIRQTLVLLGVQQIRAWVSLLTLSQLEDKPDELMVTAMVRARMCEQLALRAQVPHPEVYFTVGLFSTLDALLDLSMEDLLQSLPLSEELRDALLVRSGRMGAALDCVVRYERGEWDAVEFAELPACEIRAAYLDAVEWARVTSRELGV